MRITWPLLFFFTAVSATATAETIHLKNGRTILADSVKENNGRIEYQIGEDTYAISKSLVDHIDTGGSPPVGSHTAGKPAMDVPAPVENLRGSDQVADKLIRDGHVDQEAIDSVEHIGNAELSAAANYVAGRFEYDRGNREIARRYLQRALGFQPESPALLDLYVVTLIQLQRSSEAVPYAEQATRFAPQSADAFNLLGHAYFQADRTQDAIKAWKHSLALHDDAAVKENLEKAERESSVESSFTEAETGHFVLHYEGGQVSADLRRQIMETLESHYSALVGDLGVAPPNSIPVSLYTSQAFFDVTQAPGWAGAIYDGKLRIPVDGVTSMTPELSRVLKHEMTHAFIHQISHGRCPEWLNEGVAQAEEPRSIDSVGRRLEKLYAAQNEIPLSSLEGSWNNFSGAEAALAYYEALAGVQFIRDTYGMSEIQRLLQRIGDGASTEVALRGAIHGGYADLEEGIATYLRRTYGQ